MSQRISVCFTDVPLARSCKIHIAVLPMICGLRCAGLVLDDSVTFAILGVVKGFFWSNGFYSR